MKSNLEDVIYHIIAMGSARPALIRGISKDVLTEISQSRQASSHALKTISNKIKRQTLVALAAKKKNA